MDAITEYSTVIVAVVGAASAVAVFATKAWPVLKRIVHATDVLQKIADEFAPNGGMSLRDAVNRIEGIQHAQGVQLSVIEQRVAGLDTTTERLAEQFDDLIDTGDFG